eukprot:5049117-Pyramimonas_sp.AAC.1
MLVGVSSKPLGSLGAVLRPQGGCVGASLGPLGASWETLGGFLGPLEGLLGPRARNVRSPLLEPSWGRAGRLGDFLG